MRKNQAVLLLSALRPGAPTIALEVFDHVRDRMSVYTVAREDGVLAPRFRQLGPVSVMSDGSIRARMTAPLARARLWLNHWRGKPDMVYVNTVTALPLLRATGLTETPVLLHVHELDSYLGPVERDYRELLIDLPRRYIAVSEAVKRALVRRGVDPEKITVIPAFIRPERFEDAPAPEKPAGAPFVVGGSGYPCWHKGKVLFLQMAVEVARRLGEDSVRFVWLGVTDDPDGHYFRETARALRVDHLIEFVPPTPDPLSYYRQFDVFALTSWEDSFPLVMLENMMLRRPVVCFAESGGAVEQIGDTGVAIPGFSPLLMAESVVDLLNSPERRAEMGEAARKRVLECFTAEKSIPRICEEMDRVAGAQDG